MKRYWKLLAAGLLAASMAACASTNTTEQKESEEDVTEDVEIAADETPEKTEAAETSYAIHVKGDDWGCGVDKVILNLGVAAEGVDAETFTVSEFKQNVDWAAEDKPVFEGSYDREVLGAYLSDADGNPVDGPSEYAALELYISPNDGSPFLYNPATGFNTWSDPYEMTIALAEGKTITADGNEISELTISGKPASKTTDADAFTAAEFESSDGFTLPYATWTPEEASTTLFVWLHGMGEGGDAVVDGTDWSVPILANEVTAYIGEEFQAAVGGANVLVPQAPTYWMDTIGDYSQFSDRLEAADGTSAFTVSLHELIAQVKEDTGSEKVIIAGCSNGGYMTLVMAMNYGDEYDAFVPICEAVPDESITDEQINALAALPIYFIWADNDTTVDPATHEIPTVDRLMAAGAQEVLVSTTPDVADTTGRFTDEDGNAHQYAGHWSWVHFDNNESVTADDIKAWDWIGQQAAK